MAAHGHIIDASFPASADLSTKQYMAVELDSNGRLAVEDGDGQPIGILLDKPAAIDRAGRVAMVGSITKMQLSGTVARGDSIAPTGNGTVSGYGIVTTSNRP